jgi:ATP-dependent RNA helicase HelY
VPRDRGRDHRGLRHLADRLAELDLRALADQERAQRPEAALATLECHRCPWGATTRCDQAWREVERLAERVEQRRVALETYRSSYWQEFLRVFEVLEQFEAVRDRALTAKGRLIAGLRHDNELLVAEALTHGVLGDVTLAEAAAVCAALLEEARSGEPAIARLFLRKRPKLRRKLEQLEAIAERVREAQRARRLGMAVTIHAGFMPAVFGWASGESDWTTIVREAFGGHEGDLIRAMRRLIDLLRQLAESREVPAPTARLLLEASRVIDRGVVLESALI